MVPVKEKGIAAAMAALPPEQRPSHDGARPCGDGDDQNSDAESVSPREDIAAVSRDKLSGDGLRKPLLSD